MSNIHQTAIVSKKAEVGEDVSIGPYCIVGDRVKIKRGTQLLSHVVLEGDTSIGENNMIYPFVTIGLKPQDTKKRPVSNDAKLIIGDNNIIRESVTIHGGIDECAVTSVGNDNYFMVHSHIAHDCVVGNNCIFANSATIAGHVVVEDFVFMSAFSAVHQFCKIGKSAMICGGTLIRQDVLPYLMIEGQEAKVRGLNIEGLKRRLFTEDAIRNIKYAYSTIFRKGFRLDEALSLLKSKFPEDKNIEYMIDFAYKCERGICR